MLSCLLNKVNLFQFVSVVSADHPDVTLDPELFQVIKSQMVNRPCGPLNPNSACIVDWKCNKGYPQPLLAETETGDDGYPNYRWSKASHGGHRATTGMSQNRKVHVDNKWTVP